MHSVQNERQGCLEPHTYCLLQSFVGKDLQLLRVMLGFLCLEDILFSEMETGLLSFFFYSFLLSKLCCSQSDNYFLILFLRTLQFIPLYLQFPSIDDLLVAIFEEGLPLIFNIINKRGVQSFGITEYMIQQNGKGIKELSN